MKPAARAISNTAIVDLDEQTIVSLPHQVEFDLTWITKSGNVVEGSEGTVTDYDPSNRQIQWEIYANHCEQSLSGAKIIDTLANDLSFISATIEYYDDGWSSPQAIIPDQEGQELTFNLGTINQKIRITMITSVDIVTPPSAPFSFSNQATLTATGMPGQDSNQSSVSIGFNPISKSAGTYIPSTHHMSWTVTVNTRNLDYNGDLRVLDLLVYGDSINLDDFPGQGSGLTGFTTDDLNELTAQYNQKYLPGSFTSEDGLEVHVYTLTEDSKAVADLLVITQSGGIGLDYTKANSFSFQTTVTDPDIYADNNNARLRNNATLFSNHNKKASAAASKRAYSYILKKDMMSRENASVFEADPTDLTAVNADPAETAGGFDYNDKSVIFRIHINANDIADLTNDITQISGETLGALVVTDTLPQGWEFKKIDSEDYLLFVAENKNGSTLNAVSRINDHSSFMTTSGPDAPTASEGGKIEFTFNTLDDQYLILVKAGPTEEKGKEYFTANSTYTVRNNIEMSNSNYQTNPTSFQDISLTSTLLDKSIDLSSRGDGYVTWSVDYRPFDLAHTNIMIKDQLPIGIDLRMDAMGDLIVENNITMIEQTLNADGSYSDGAAVDLSGGDILSYDDGQRTLTFMIPDGEKAYKISYITDITGEPGTISNHVTLTAQQQSATEDSCQLYHLTGRCQCWF